MKKTVLVFSIIGTVLILVLAGCQLIGVLGEEEKDSLTLSEELFQDNDYNLDFRDFTLAVGQALRTSPDFRKVVKDEALKRVDGDYDVLLTRVKDKKVKAPIMYKSAGEAYTVKDLLNDSFSSESRMRLNKSSSTSSVIDELSEKYPDMQIAVPVHAEEWDEENYIPTVTFLPLEYSDATTTTLTGYDVEGNMVPIDVLNEPDEAVIVIGQNERSDYYDNRYDPDKENDDDNTVGSTPPTPINLTGQQTPTGILLNWDISSEATLDNTQGYNVYRKGPFSSSFTYLETVSGMINTEYNDYELNGNYTYMYYIVAYNRGNTSPISNKVTVTAPPNPNPVVSFNVNQVSKNKAELSWVNDKDVGIISINIEKKDDINGEYMPFLSFDHLTSFCEDEGLTSGKHYGYRINYSTATGPSDYVYDFVKVPYRDISNDSPVFIKQIKFTDWRIERWPAGRPEFLINVLNVNSTHQSYVVEEDIFCKFEDRENVSQVFFDKFVIDWDPGYWYDILTFVVVEHDSPWFEVDFTVSAAYGVKKPFTNDASKWDMDLDISAGAEITLRFTDESEYCGKDELGYYEDPEQWLKFPNYGVEILVSESDD